MGTRLNEETSAEVLSYPEKLGMRTEMRSMPLVFNL